MSKELIELSSALAQETERAAASVVAVHTEPRGSSSGVVWRPGIIVTADHALRRDEEIQVTLPGGGPASATLAGRDPSTDLAVLKCAETNTANSQASDVSAVKPGSLVLVVGRTRASGPVAAMGVVSLVVAERRSWMGAGLSPYIRLDVGLQPTAIGGVVVDAEGRALGMATPRFARFGAVIVPAPTVEKIVDTLLEKGRIPRGYLGVGLHPVRLPESLRQSLHRNERTALIAVEVAPDSPAQKAGILIGDILLSFGGRPLAHLEDLHAQLSSEAIGKEVSIQLVRGGKATESAITVGEREPEAD